MIPTKFSLTILLLALTSTLSRPLVREVRTDREFQRLLKVSITTHKHSSAPKNSISNPFYYQNTSFFFSLFPKLLSILAPSNLLNYHHTTIISTTKPKQVSLSLSITTPMAVVPVVKLHLISKN